MLTRKLTELPKISKNELSSTILCVKKTVWFYEEVTVQATRNKNQLHQLKRELDLSRSTEEKQVLAVIIKGKTAELTQIKNQQKKLTTALGKLLEKYGKNLTSFPGIGIVSAAKIVAHTNGIERFATVDKFLSYAGIAPKERSSGKSKRHIQSTKGNRRLNYALYWVAVNQLTRNQKAKAGVFERRGRTWG